MKNASTTNPALILADTFFDLTLKGGIPTILRQIADRLDSGEAIADQVQTSVTRGQVQITLILNVNPQ
jgi:hypothetical protein